MTDVTSEAGSDAESEVRAAQQDLIEDFQFFDDWMDRYGFLIDMGKDLPEFPAEHLNDGWKITGCQSQVWLYPQHQGDRLHFSGKSDASIVSGLIAVLLKVYSDRKPADILANKPDFVADIGFGEHLSPTRSNGLHAMLKAIYVYAEVASRGLPLTTELVV